MKILACHNFYQIPGGEDQCFADEMKLLQRHGHQVVRYEKNNDGIGGAKAALVAGKAIWNYRTYREVQSLITEHEIDLVHCTNTFPVISPSIYYACNRQKVPVVQSLHNYRLFCANSYFLRDGKICEDCLSKRVAMPAIKHACYRDNRLATTAVVALQAIHHGVGSWRKRVDQFVALTPFAKQKCIEGGLPAEKISVKANFVDPAPTPSDKVGDYALFVGRLFSEKGIHLLLKAWQDDRCSLPLRIVGGGPLQSVVEEAAASNPKIEYVGFQSPEEVLGHMRSARFTLVPSLWYEGLPRTIVESFAVGTPVVASKIGPMADLVRPDGGGVPFELGNVDDLIRAASQLCNDPNQAMELRRLALAEFHANYTAEANYATLMQAYRAAYRQCHGCEASGDWCVGDRTLVAEMESQKTVDSTVRSTAESSADLVAVDGAEIGPPIPKSTTTSKSTTRRADKSKAR